MGGPHWWNPATLVLAGLAVGVSPPGVGHLLVGASAACVSDLDCGGDFTVCDGIVGCVDGECVNRPAPSCHDTDPCTVDACDDFRGGCVHDPLCVEDGLVCNGEAICVVLDFPFSSPPICLSPPLDCDDADACTIDGCVEPIGCRHVLVDCDDGDPCTADGCDSTSGCVHDGIAGCCRTAGDCPTDRCHGRQCVNRRCTSPAPVSCDDGDASTLDACDPARGCTHAAAGSTTTLPSVGAACQRDADCPAGEDPCLAGACDAGGGCVRRRVGGFESLACVCSRPAPVACSGVTLPRTVTRHTDRACRAIGRARAARPAKRRRLLRQVVRRLARAQTALRSTGGGNAVPRPCGDALAAQLDDGLRRARALAAARPGSP